ncbi:MAG: SRPBCC domain-containing protein [Chloroflexi bacterium]|nr:SRPBCC domain-containing protein [Chloroflexota bacterium]
MVTYHREHGGRTRRLLLDRLFERDGRTLLELQSQLTMSRFGVMKHVRVLVEAGLVTTRKVGREKLHFLNPVPIHLIYDRWIGKYTAERTSALVDLKAILEGADTMTIEPIARPKQVYQLFIKAPPERVWEALTTSEFTTRYYYGCMLKTDLTVGSPFTYTYPDGSAAIVEGEVLACDPPRRLVHSYHSLWGPLADDAPTRVTWELEAMPSGITKLTVIHDDFDGETATYQGLAGGGWNWILSNLKTLLETGEPLPEQH